MSLPCRHHRVAQLLQRQGSMHIIRNDSFATWHGSNVVDSRRMGLRLQQAGTCTQACSCSLGNSRFRAGYPCFSEQPAARRQLGCLHQHRYLSASKHRKLKRSEIQWRRRSAPMDESSSSQETNAGRLEASASGSHPQVSKEMLAAIALSPFAALSLQASQQNNWADYLRMAFAEAAAQAAQTYQGVTDKVGQRWHQYAESDRGQVALQKLHESMMYMEWSYNWLGLDLTYVWDPELWHLFWTDRAEFCQRLADKVIYYTELPAPPMKDMRISYTKFLQLLQHNKVKRIIVLGDMRTAIVEVPQQPSDLGWNMTGGDALSPEEPSPLLINPDAMDDPMQWYAPELPEWEMEKYRFYLDLPGDFWEDGKLLAYLRQRYARPLWDPNTQQFIMPYKHFTKVGECRIELTVLDPSDSWEFAQFLLVDSNAESLIWVAIISVLCNVVLALEDLWYLTLAPVVTLLIKQAQVARDKLLSKGKKKKSQEETLMQQMGKSKARLFNIAGGSDEEGKAKGTGVTFKDVAGLDQIVFELREITKLLLRDDTYVKVGAQAPKGILFQGPPGTGKTYLARAMAGEAGVPFLSCNGAEFVEMFQGVAQLRMQNLFDTARKYRPCIIFIDEIDAIGKARSYDFDDPGAVEREMALLEMLVQMDGIDGDIRGVLTVGATNMVDELDAALLRPGRMEIIFNVGTPSPGTRLAILHYHARNKPFEPNEREPILRKVAQVTDCWSAASLANLLNEAAIISVRKDMDRISLPLLLEIIDSYEHGDVLPRLPSSEAKNRFALATAGKAVAYALTPGMDEMKFVTIWPKKEFLSCIEFKDDLVGHYDMGVRSWQTNVKANASWVGDHRLGEFYHLSLMLIPLYAERATEFVFFGPDGVTLGSADSLGDAFEIAYYLARISMLHPRFSRMPPLHSYMYFGKNKGVPDPLTKDVDLEINYHKLAITLLKAAWQRAVKLVSQRRQAIIKVAEEMLADEIELLQGERLVQIVESAPVDDASDVQVDKDFLSVVDFIMGNTAGVIRQGLDEADTEYLVFAAGKVGDATFPAEGGKMGQATFTRPEQAGPLMRISHDDVKAVARAIMGRLDMADLIGKNTSMEVAERVREALLHEETRKRLLAIRKYVEHEDGEFPPPPELQLPVYASVHKELEFWKKRRFNVITEDAIDMLFSQRQLKYYKQDMDLPAKRPKKPADKA